MKATLGVVMILVAVLLGAVLSLGMYEFETAKRSTQASAEAAAHSPAGDASAQKTGATSAGLTGEKLFAAKCNACHPNGNAGIGPAVRGTQLAAKYPDDASLKQIIRGGRGGMPPYPPASLSDGDLEATIVYLRSLQ